MHIVAFARWVYWMFPYSIFSGERPPAGLAFTQNSETTISRSPQHRMEFRSASRILIQDTGF